MIIAGGSELPASFLDHYMKGAPPPFSHHKKKKTNPPKLSESLGKMD